MANATGLGSQAGEIIMEFTRCWEYLGQLGVMARDMIEGEGMENSDLQKKVQLSRIITLVEKAANTLKKRNSSLRNAISTIVVSAVRVWIVAFIILYSFVRLLKVLECVWLETAARDISTAVGSSTRDLGVAEESLATFPIG